jgi:hypothetical protein
LQNKIILWIATNSVTNMLGLPPDLFTQSLDCLRKIFRKSPPSGINQRFFLNQPQQTGLLKYKFEETPTKLIKNTVASSNYGLDLSNQTKKCPENLVQQSFNILRHVQISTAKLRLSAESDQTYFKA